jgi:hypothetical protein
MRRLALPWMTIALLLLLVASALAAPSTVVLAVEGMT